MSCDHARDLIGAYLDGELSGADRQAVSLQLQRCPACADYAGDLRRMSRQLGTLARLPAPAGLADRIRTELAAAATSEPVSARRIALAWPASFARMAAMLLVACALSSALTYAALTSRASETRLETEIVAAHIRSLLQDSPIQVTSSDTHTVKPWFAGRIDFAPEVRDLTAEGFPLVGGRIDYVGERRVGAIVYKRHLHTINVFMWPAPDAAPTAPARHIAKGYNALTWSKNGITYWAVSDLNLAELRQLQMLL